MLVHGYDCSIVIKTSHVEMDIPYSSETLREAVSMLYEEASIEGDGIRRGIRTAGGVTGCVVTPLTIGTAPLLLYLAMGGTGIPQFVSETRDLYRWQLNLLPLEDTEHFDLIQDRVTGNREQGTNNKERKIFEECRVKAFELRFVRGETVKLKLDIAGECAPGVYPYTDTIPREQGERFSGDYVTYAINGREYKNIYGATLLSQKENGTKTEVWIRRSLEHGSDIPEIIDELTITAQLLRDKYEARHYGAFRIILKSLVMVSDETEVDTAGALIGPLRYYAAGTVTAEVFTNREKTPL